MFYIVWYQRGSDDERLGVAESGLEKQDADVMYGPCMGPYETKEEAETIKEAMQTAMERKGRNA